ncbi:TPA: hypothetical protein ACH3X2_006363 [Trebouxia sp. C0005]
MLALQHTVKPITILPLDAMEAISFHLPPQSLVALSATSRHFKNMLSHDWLWRTQLQQKHPKWAVTPKNGGVWKELVVVATQLEALASYEICLDLHRRLKWQSTEDSGTQAGTYTARFLLEQACLGSTPAVSGVRQ